jgi:hypothetical protein
MYIGQSKYSKGSYQTIKLREVDVMFWGNKKDELSNK